MKTTSVTLPALPAPLRVDLQTIADWIAPHTQVLDLGCGRGELLAWLAREKQVSGYGVEIEVNNIVACVAAGVNAIQGDLEAGLSAFESGAFDCVVLSQTLQAMRNIEALLPDMLRVGREAIVSFPNFGHWRNRVQILKGQMPVTETIPYQWYDTPNIHWCTLVDFEQLCARLGIVVRERMVIDNSYTAMDDDRLRRLWPNLFGSLAFYRLGRA